MKLSSTSVSVMQKQLKVLEEEENELKMQCERVKKELNDDDQEVWKEPDCWTGTGALQKNKQTHTQVYLAGLLG